MRIFWIFTAAFINEHWIYRNEWNIIGIIIWMGIFIEVLILWLKLLIFAFLIPQIIYLLKKKNVYFYVEDML